MTPDRDPALANPYDLDRIEPLGLPESARPRSRAVRRALALGAMSAGLGVVGAGAASADPGPFSDPGDVSFAPDYDLSSDFSTGGGDFFDIELSSDDLDVPELPDVTVTDDVQAAAQPAAAAAVVPVMNLASVVSPDLSGEIEVSDSDLVVESAPVESLPVELAPVDAAPVDAAPVEEFVAGGESAPVVEPAPDRTLPAFDASSYNQLDTDSVVPDGSVVDLADAAAELYLVTPETDPERYRQLEQQLDGEDAPERVSNPFRTLDRGSTGDSTEATGVAAAADRGELVYASAAEGFDVSDAGTAVTDRQREVLGTSNGDGTPLLAQTPLPVPSPGKPPLGDSGRGAGGRQTPPPPSNDNLTDTQRQLLSPSTRESIGNIRENPPFGAYGQPLPGLNGAEWLELVKRGGAQFARNGPAIQGVAERDLYYSGVNPLLDDIVTGNLTYSGQSLVLGALGNTLSSAQSVKLQGQIGDNAGLVAGTNKEANTLSEAATDLNTVSARNNQIANFNAGTQQDYRQAGQRREFDMGNLVSTEQLQQGPIELTNGYLAYLAHNRPLVADAVIKGVPVSRLKPELREEVAFHRGVMEELRNGKAPAYVVDELRRDTPEVLTSYSQGSGAPDPRIPSNREVVSGIYDPIPEPPQLERFDETPFDAAYQRARRSLQDTPDPVNNGTPALTDPDLPAPVDPPDVDVNPDEIVERRDERVAQLQQLDTAWLGFKVSNPEAVAALGLAGAYIDTEPPNIVATNYYRGDNNKLTARIYQLAENAETSRAQAEQARDVTIQGITTGAENFDRAVDTNAAITGATIGQIVDTATGNAEASIARTEGNNALTSELQQRRGDYSDQLQIADQERVEATQNFRQQSGTNGGIGSAGVELFEVQRRLMNPVQADPELAGLMRGVFLEKRRFGPALTRRALVQAVDSLSSERVGQRRDPVSVDQYIAETPLAPPAGVFRPLRMDQLRQLSPEARQRYMQYLNGKDGLTTEQRRLVDGLPPDGRLEFFETYEGIGPGDGS